MKQNLTEQTRNNPRIMSTLFLAFMVLIMLLVSFIEDSDPVIEIEIKTSTQIKMNSKKFNNIESPPFRLLSITLNKLITITQKLHGEAQKLLPSK